MVRQSCSLHTVRPRLDQVTEEIYSKAFSKLPEPIGQKELEALRQTFAWQTLVPTLFARAVEQIRVRRLDS